MTGRLVKEYVFVSSDGEESQFCNSNGGQWVDCGSCRGFVGCAREWIGGEDIIGIRVSDEDIICSSMKEPIGACNGSCMAETCLDTNPDMPLGMKRLVWTFRHGEGALEAFLEEKEGT